MKGEDLLRGLSELDEKWIEEASVPVKRKKKPPVFYYRILAACAVYLIVGSAVFFAWQHDGGQNRLQLYQESEEPAVPEATEETDRTGEPADSTGEQHGIETSAPLWTSAPFGTANPSAALETDGASPPAQQPGNHTAGSPFLGQNGGGSVYEDSHIIASDQIHSIHDIQGAEGLVPNGTSNGTNSLPGGTNEDTTSRPDGTNEDTISRPAGEPGSVIPKPPVQDAAQSYASQNPPAPVKTQTPKPTAKPTLAPKPTQASKTPEPPRTPEPSKTPEPPKTPEPEPTGGADMPKPTLSPPETEPTFMPPGTEEPMYTDSPTPTGAPDVIGSPGIAYGDLNDDKKIDTEDAMLVLRHIQNITLLNEEKQKYADVDGDGKVTIHDFDLILQRAAGMIDRFPVE